MDVLVCEKCERRFSVRASGDGGGWRCIHCSAELAFVETADLRGPSGVESVVDWHLHYLRSLPGPPDRYRDQEGRAA